MPRGSGSQGFRRPEVLMRSGSRRRGSGQRAWSPVPDSGRFCDGSEPRSWGRSSFDGRGPSWCGEHQSLARLQRPVTARLAYRRWSDVTSRAGAKRPGLDRSTTARGAGTGKGLRPSSTTSRPSPSLLGNTRNSPIVAGRLRRGIRDTSTGQIEARFPGSNTTCEARLPDGSANVERQVEHRTKLNLLPFEEHATEGRPR